jgi:serine/threonine protein kinase
MFQLLRGLNYLHTTKKVVHRDLKLENILLVSQDRNNLEIKIADFGFAKEIKGDKDTDTEDLQCGTPLYMAPEVFDPDNNNGYRFEVDIWSAGVIAYILLLGRAPFDGKNRKEIQKRILADPPVTFTDNDRISNEAKEFLLLMLNRD